MKKQKNWTFIANIEIEAYARKFTLCKCSCFQKINTLVSRLKPLKNKDQITIMHSIFGKKCKKFIQCSYSSLKFFFTKICTKTSKKHTFWFWHNFNFLFFCFNISRKIIILSRRVANLWKKGVAAYIFKMEKIDYRHKTFIYMQMRPSIMYKKIVNVFFDYLKAPQKMLGNSVLKYKKWFIFWKIYISFK